MNDELDLSLLDSLSADTDAMMFGGASDSDPFGSFPAPPDLDALDPGLLWPADLDLSPGSQSCITEESPIAPTVRDTNNRSPVADLKSELVLFPFDSPSEPPAHSVPQLPQHSVPPEPISTCTSGHSGQENRHAAANVPSVTAITEVTPVKRPPVKTQPELYTPKAEASVTSSADNSESRTDASSPPSPSQRAKDKLAQRKLRNKESARRYREKQVMRRRQLENYTRTLTEQNRELETLHDKLLTLTCERRMQMLSEAHPTYPGPVPGASMPAMQH